MLPLDGESVVTACPGSACGAALNHCMHPEMKVRGCGLLLREYEMVFQVAGFCVCVIVLLVLMVVVMMMTVALLLPPDHPPSWLHVSVHPVLWGADHGPVEVSSAEETYPHLLSSTCRGGLL